MNSDQAVTPATSPFAISESAYHKFPKDLPSLLRLPGLERFGRPDGEQLLELSVKQYGLALNYSPLVPIRGVQRTFGVSPWEWTIDDSDVNLGRGPVRVASSVSMEGADVVGHRLNLGDGLTHDQGVFLLALLHLKSRKTVVDEDVEAVRPVQTEHERAYEQFLLCHVTREIRDPPIDLDVRDESEEWAEKGGLEYTRKTNTEYAKRMCESLKNLWGCEPIVYVTNALKWSIHLDVLAPVGARSALLSQRTAYMKRVSMENCEIPEATNHKDHAKGPAIVCDSGIWVRDPSSRGGLWCPPLGRKFDKVTRRHKPQKKLWLKDIDDPSSLREPPAGLDPVPFSRDCF